MKRTKQSTFAKRERSEKSTRFAPVGSEDTTPHATHTPQWELSSKHRDEQYIDEPLAEELRPLFRIHWDNNVSDTEAEQGATLIAAAPAMYEALSHAAMSYHHPACKCKGEYSANPELYCTCHVQKARAALAQAEGRQA